jgi:anti-sigma factor RsiW
MAMTESQDREAQSIEELLPWYAKGTLDPDDMRQVSDYLGAHPEMQFHLDLIREELAETVAANESLSVPGAAARERLFAAIRTEPAASTTARLDLSGWWRSLLPAGASPGFAFAAAAACALILVQAAALIAFAVAPADNGYRVASGDTPQAQPGSYVLVRFADDAKVAQIAALLKEVNAVVVDGPKPGGVFKIRIAAHVLGQAERESVIQKLREKSDIVSFVAPAG